MRMMSYRYDKKEKKKKRKIAVGIVILVVMLVTPFFQFLYNTLDRTIARAYQNRNGLRVESQEVLDVVRLSKKTILEKNKELSEKVQYLESENNHLRFLYEQLQEVPAVESLDTDTTFVLEHSVLSPDSLIIQGGTNRSFEPGLRVFASGYVLIGYIEETFSDTSRVRLLTDGGINQQGVLFSQDARIELIGEGGLEYLSLIDRNIEVSVGDTVYALGVPGYTIGHIAGVTFDPRDPFQEVRITPGVNIRNLTQVSIEKSSL